MTTHVRYLIITKRSENMDDIKVNHSRPDVPYPHYVCPVCDDWFHMPWKFCKCDPPNLNSPSMHDDGSVEPWVLSDRDFKQFYRACVPWWRRWLRRLTYIIRSRG